jgi:hypothetical protein
MQMLQGLFMKDMFSENPPYHTLLYPELPHRLMILWLLQL